MKHLRQKVTYTNSKFIPKKYPSLRQVPEFISYPLRRYMNFNFKFIENTLKNTFELYIHLCKVGLSKPVPEKTSIIFIFQKSEIFGGLFLHCVINVSNLL